MDRVRSVCPLSGADIRLCALCGHPAELVGHPEADDMAGNGLAKENRADTSAVVPLLTPSGI